MQGSIEIFVILDTSSSWSVQYSPYIMSPGARYFENCTVDRVLAKNGRVSAVVSSLGTISCEIFVNCAGMVRAFHKVYKFFSCKI